MNSEERIAAHEARQRAEAEAARIERALRALARQGRRRAPHPRTVRAQAAALRERAE